MLDSGLHADTNAKYKSQKNDEFRPGQVVLTNGPPSQTVVAQNPKYVQALKDGKIPFEFIPMGPMAAVARVLQSGADKYGVRNWRLDPIKASTYEGAIGRHMYLEWAQGVDKDKDSREHPLAHVIASCLIIMDAQEHGMLIDDRDRKESKGE